VAALLLAAALVLEAVVVEIVEAVGVFLDVMSLTEAPELVITVVPTLLALKLFAPAVIVTGMLSISLSLNVVVPIPG
jgi:hypothetical protein